MFPLFSFLFVLLSYPCSLLFFRLKDHIIVMKDGQVVEEGTHDELLRRGGLYYTMWLQQSATSESEEG